MEQVLSEALLQYNCFPMFSFREPSQMWSNSGKDDRLNKK